MILLGNIMIGVAVVLKMILYFVFILVIARVIISWVSADPYNPIVRFIASSTDPILRPVQRYVPIIGGGLDLSPIIVIFAIYFLEYALVNSLLEYGARMKM